MRHGRADRVVNRRFAADKPVDLFHHRVEHPPPKFCGIFHILPFIILPLCKRSRPEWVAEDILMVVLRGTLTIRPDLAGGEDLSRGL